MDNGGWTFSGDYVTHDDPDPTPPPAPPPPRPQTSTRSPSLRRQHLAAPETILSPRPPADDDPGIGPRVAWCVTCLVKFEIVLQPQSIDLPRAKGQFRLLEFDSLKDLGFRRKRLLPRLRESPG